MSVPVPLYRPAYIRGAPNRKQRSATFTAATENAVDTGYGPEVLRMSGCDLRNYERNPVVLDSHRRESCRDVVGKAVARVEGQELVSEITYLDDEDGERVWKKVDADAVRSVSIGYAIDPTSVVRVRKGETREGVEGPAIIVNRWSLIEISNVPVPADGAATRREFFARALGETMKTDEDEREEDEAENAPPPKDDEDQGEREGDDEAGERADSETAKSLIAEAEELGCSVDEIAQVTDRDPAVIEAIKSGEMDEVPDDFVSDLRQLVASKREEAEDSSEEREDDDEDEDEGERGLAAAQRAFVRSAPEGLRELAQDVYLENPRRSLTKVWRDVVAIAPSWAKEDALKLIRANPRGTLDDHRRALLELRAKRMAPAGSGPSSDPTPPANAGNSNPPQREDAPQDFSGLF